MTKTSLEAEIRKLKTRSQKDKNEKHSKPILHKRDTNANIVDTKAASSELARPLFTSSMVSPSHHLTNSFLRPADITSMITHCTLPPGSSLLSLEEVLKALDKAVERLNDSMKWCSSST